MRNTCASSGLAASDPIRHLLIQIADFSALFEAVEEKLIKRSNDIKEKIDNTESQLLKQLTQIQTTLANFESMMTQEGAARWRIAAKTAKQDAELYLQTLQQTCGEICSFLHKNSENLKHSAQQTLDQITNIAKIFPTADFKQITTTSCQQIKTTSFSIMQQTSSLIKKIHSKNLIMAISLTLLIAFNIGLYLTDEWPWEIHKQVVKERLAGRTLLAAWPQLSSDEKQDIMMAAKKSAAL